MIRPVNYRQSSWDFIVDSQTGDLVAYDERHPGRLAYDKQIHLRPELITDTVIDLEDEVEYLIDETASRKLDQFEGRVVLFRLIDRQPREVEVRQVIKALRDGTVFDQLESAQPQ